MTERLQKVMSHAGIASRRKAEEMILAGKVKVNNKIVTELGAKVDPKKDIIIVDGGKPIKQESKIYVLFHKPKGVVTTAEDPEGRTTVLHYIKGIKQRIYPVGRLDYNTDGILLLTNDGDLAYGITHPSHEIEKTYVVQVRGLPKEEELDILRSGVKLEDGITAPAKVKILGRDEIRGLTKFEMIIHEGKNREIRRMCETIGYPVRSLSRIKLAFLTLQGLRRGQYRYLTEEEVLELQELIKN